jgi:CDGSH-type Zn-finger protein
MNKKTIKVSKNGPFLVSGGIPLIKLVILTDEEGYPVEWVEKNRYPEQESYSLCRCGQSKEKPFCDGTHDEINFNGTETATHDSYDVAAKITQGPDLILADNHKLCTHAGFCTRAGTIGFLVRNSENPEYRKLAIEEAANCDSGRFVVYEKDSGKVIEPELEISIAVVEEPDKGVSGPLWVRAGIPIESAEGEVYEIRNRVTLCRCGKSFNKPFCDGTHLMIGFNDGDDSIN